MKILLQEFGSYEDLPPILESKILEMEDITQTEVSRKKFKFLGHIPLSCEFKFVELDMKKVVSHDALKPFLDELNRRTKKRLKQKRLDKLEREKEKSFSKMTPIDYSYENFPPATPKSEFEELDVTLEAVIKASLEETKLDSEPSTTNEPKKSEETILVQEEKKNFLAALIAPEPIIPKNAPVKVSKKHGKQYILLSTSNTRRRK